MNKFFKLIGLTTALTLMGVTGVYAQDGFSSKVSGNIRLNSDVDTKTAGDNDPKTTSSSFHADGEETFIGYESSYTSGDNNVTALIKLLQDGRQRINVTANSTEGDWTAKGFVEWDDVYGARDAVTSESAHFKRDVYINLNHASGFSITAGRDEWLDTYMKTAANSFDFNGSLHLRDALTGGTDELRYDAVAIGYALEDLGLDFKLVYQFSNKDDLAAGFIHGLNNEITDVAATNSSNAIMVNYNNAEVLGLSISLEHLNASSKGLKIRDFSRTGLGISLTPIEALTIGISNDSQTSKTDEETDGLAENSSLIAVNYELGDLGGVSLHIGNATKPAGEIEEDGKDDTLSYTEFAYKTSLGPVTLHTGVIMGTETTDDVENKRETYRVRFNYAF